MTEHTPGKWAAHEVLDGPEKRRFTIEAGNDVVARWVYEAADARLIAVAPSLLKAAELFAAWDRGPHLTDSSLDPVRKAIFAAIAEARNGH